MPVLKDQNSWSLNSWRSKHAAQQPEYKAKEQLKTCLQQVSDYPPLVFEGEVDSLKKELADASVGKKFLLQGGDCAERFQDCNRSTIMNKINILLQMSVVLCYGSRRPVIRVGRIAGQYGKPRSNKTEEVDGVQLPVYRGDNVNSFEPEPNLREPDPTRLLQGYHFSALTLNYIRALSSGGFADLHHPDNWNLDFVAKSPHWPRYEEIVLNIKNAITFMETIGYKDTFLSGVDFYTSHEGLILPYEEAQTKKSQINDKYYNLGAHMLWIGDRTRQLDGAHIEYFRGIANPIGIKVGPSADPAELVKAIEILNPEHEMGRITLITRFGAGKANNYLPNIIKAVTEADLPVCWSCDPMHGNAIKTKNNIKTRDFNAILNELKETFSVHLDIGSHLGGVHFELTGDNVTECTGGSEGITDTDLSRSYQTYCDPRLNYSQSLEMAFLISSMLEEKTKV
ncbi:MAG: class II 3-deoxy-7-phosphoheptulonate synthase [Oligoflexales bacterium]